MRVRISAHVLERCLGALRMCRCPLLHHDQCEAIQTTFSGTLGLSLFSGSGDDLAAYFNVVPPDTSSLFRPTNSDEGQNFHVATPDRILIVFAVQRALYSDEQSRALWFLCLGCPREALEATRKGLMK